MAIYYNYKVKPQKSKPPKNPTNQKDEFDQHSFRNKQPIVRHRLRDGHKLAWIQTDSRNKHDRVSSDR